MIVIAVVAVLFLHPAEAARKTRSTMLPEDVLLPDVYPLDAVPDHLASTAPAVGDACAAYIKQPRFYAVCRDQLKKIQRMKEAGEQRRAALQGVTETPR